MPSGVFSDWGSCSVVRISIRVTGKEEEYLRMIDPGIMCSNYFRGIVTNLLLDDSAHY